MKCDFCDAKASVFLTQLVEGQMKKVSLCEVCAKERGVTDPTGFSLADLLLGGITGELGGLSASPQPGGGSGDKACPACGFTLEDLRRVRRFGCAECYTTFREEITPMLRGMHKGVSHVGKVPEGLMALQFRHQRLQDLRARLEQAVASENYEEAAGIRDEIHTVNPAMMRFSTLIKNPADWMTGGQTEHGAVMTSRIRLARNLRRHPFPGWAKSEQRAAALDLMRPAVESLPVMKDAFSQELGGLSPVHKQVLVERHLVSREHAARGEGSAVIIERRQSFSFMLNEEDHLRMQAIRPGLQLSSAYEALTALDTELEATLEFAFDPTLGYLTTCPTNLGTGLRASVMLHLPGLVLSDQIGQVLQAVSKIGLAVRGLYGEGTESLGHLYQISNQSSLGESEETIIRRLERVIGQVAQHEQNARDKLLEDDPEMVADKIGRAYGVLRHAHIIDSKEALNHLSLLRLGGTLGFFARDTVSLCDTLLMDIQPAHLQFFAQRKLSPEERDSIRAQIVRGRLQNLQSSDTSTPSDNDPPLPDADPPPNAS